MDLLLLFLLLALDALQLACAHRPVTTIGATSTSNGPPPNTPHAAPSAWHRTTFRLYTPTCVAVYETVYVQVSAAVA